MTTHPSIDPRYKGIHQVTDLKELPGKVVVQAQKSGTAVFIRFHDGGYIFGTPVREQWDEFLDISLETRPELYDQLKCGLINQPEFDAAVAKMDAEREAKQKQAKWDAYQKMKAEFEPNA